MADKILLIDGHSILNRAFYGLPLLTNAEGLYTNGVYGFLNILTKILEEEKPEYLTVAFDVHAKTFRHEMYEAYKGTRKPMPTELRGQVELLKEVLKAMGIHTVEKPGLEADDILGTLSKSCAADGMEVVIVSGDRDLLQLATDKVKVRIPKTKQGKTEIEDYLAEDVVKRYEVTPKQIIELKALMGDSADNIPGVPGIGEKTATKIITAFGTIENAYEHVDEIKPNRAKESLQNNYELAVMSKSLATIEVDAEVPFELEKARLQNLYTEEAYQIFKRLEFKNLLNRFEDDMSENDFASSFTQVTELSEAEEIFEKCKTKEYIGLHVECEGVQVEGISITLSAEETFYLKAEGFMTGDYLKGKIKECLNFAATIVVWDLKPLVEVLNLQTTKGFFDVHVAVYLLNPLKNDYEYDVAGGEYKGLTIPSKVDLLGKKSEKKEEDTLSLYCNYVSFTVYEIYEPVLKRLEQEGMRELYEQIEMPLIITLAHMEQEGILVDEEALQVYGDELGEKIKSLESSIYEMAGEQFNINSPKQLGVILFEHMGLQGGKKTKTGYSTAADVLEKLAPENPVVAKILEYRQLTKLKSTYADGLTSYIQKDSRIHGKFHQTITATGRISSTEPNLQNIPIRMELGRLIRKVFLPKEGFVFVDADYSQIELRVLASCSEDEKLIQAYKEAQDIHRLTASQVFHTPFDEVTELQRRNAKAVNFGIVYGISSFGLSQDLSITRKEAETYIQKYFETYPGIKLFLDKAVSDAKEKGAVTTLFGRKRPVPELKSGNFMQRSFGERVAMNAPIQGTAADIIKIAMIRVDERLRSGNMESRLILQVHDELLIEAKESEVEQVYNILKEEMSGAANLLVPLEIDVHEGKTWYEAK